MMPGGGKLVLIGAGRLAHYLGRQATAAGWTITQVYARQIAAAEALAGLLGAKATDQVAALAPDADWYLLAVSDDAIVPLAEALAPHLPPSTARVLHCAGAVALAPLQAIWPRAGVLYPLQSFSAIGPPPPAPFPWFWEAGQPEDAPALAALAQSLSPQAQPLDSAGRLRLHLAAVFANNFSNHCQTIAAALLEQHQLPFALLGPLLRHGLDKVLHQGPAMAQTGPALRGDHHTMAQHLALLAHQPEWGELYQLLSASIARYHQK